ncbi:HSP70 domain-containing protein, partial [Thalassiosira pseudonana CCMP1335]
IVGVITDPAAVCIAHGLTEIEHAGNVLVIDWGASGLTATHIRRTSPNSSLISVVRHASDSSCSGNAIVDALVAHCASMFERKNKVSGLLDSVKAHHRLEMACESAVRTLSRAPTTTVALDGLYEGMDMSVPISRPRFDMLVGGVLKKAEILLQTFGADAVEFDVVLVAGNVCDMPAATTLVRTKLFPNAHAGRGDVPPDEAVAIGCARHAASVDGTEGVGPSTRNVTVSPIAIGISNGELEKAIPLIAVGEPLPANVTRSITVDGSSSISIVQMQGESVSSKVIGTIDKVPSDSKSLEVTLELSAEGSLTVAL